MSSRWWIVGCALFALGGFASLAMAVEEAKVEAKKVTEPAAKTAKAALSQAKQAAAADAANKPAKALTTGMDDEAAVRSELDAIIGRACAAAGLAPASPIDDAAFVRRVWLDVAGRVPPAAEARRIAKFKGSGEDRRKLVETLLASTDAANHWGRMWAEYYLDERPFEQDDYDGRLLQRRLFEAFHQNQSYRRVASEILLAQGSSDSSGPANLIMRYDANPAMLAGFVSKKLLGCSLQCAECHDHPHEHWKQADFRGLAAFFSRLRRMEPAEEPEGDAFAVILERGRGEMRVDDPEAKANEDGSQPQKIVYPRLPGGAIVELSDDRRAALAKWVTSPSNPYFARHFVSRTWRQFFGEELVASLDKLGPMAKPEEAKRDHARDNNDSTLKSEILEHLAADFASHDGDIHRLVRVIVLSDAYQRAAASSAAASSADGASEAESAAEQQEARELAHFARYPLRTLSVDQLYLSIAQATGYRGDDYDVRLAESSQEDFNRDLPGEYFGGETLSLSRSTALLNGDFVREASQMAAEGAGRMFGETPGPRHIEWLFLSTLSRSPESDEMESMLELAASAEGGLPDVAWALLNSAEFNVNH